MDKKQLKSLWNQIDETLIKLKSRLKDKIRPNDISLIYSLIAKVPFKVLTIKEIYLHRTYDFAISSRLLLKENRLVPAILLVRSIMETNSIFYRINELSSNAIKQKNPDELDDEAMIVLCGTRDADEKEYKAKNILGYIDKIQKSYVDYRYIYDSLSEFVHPNHDGCLGTYGQIDETNNITNLGFDLEYNDLFYFDTVRFLLLNLDLFINEYDKCDEMLPDLIKLCEEKLKNNSN